MTDSNQHEQTERIKASALPHPEQKPETIQLPAIETFSVEEKKESFFVPIVGWIIFFLPILIAFRLCDWRVVTSFLISIISVPTFFIGLEGLYRAYVQHETVDWKDAASISGIFILFSVPIYFLVVLPLYHLLKTFSFPIILSFPLLITAIAFSFFLLMVTKPWGIKEILIILVCSVFHSMVILLGITLLKKWFPGIG